MASCCRAWAAAGLLGLLLCALAPPKAAAKEYTPYDGFYNNRGLPSLGAYQTELLRRLPQAYSDGVYTLVTNRPLARAVSQVGFRGASGLPSATNRTALLAFFGQQVLAEVADVEVVTCPPERITLRLPQGDPDYDTEHKFHGYNVTGDKIMPLQRSAYALVTGQGPGVPREQLNQVTPYIDAGTIYGPNRAWADLLRSFKGGQLAIDTSAVNVAVYLRGLGCDCADLACRQRNEANCTAVHRNSLPPYNVRRLPLPNPPPPVEHRLYNTNRLRAVGGRLTNESPMALALATIWFREHNWQAMRLQAEHPTWGDDRLFQEARQWVIANLQSVVYNDYLPALLDVNLTAYNGYDFSVDPQATQEFVAAAGRWGLTLIPPGVFRRNAACTFRTSGARHPSTQSGTLRTCNTYWDANIALDDHLNVNDEIEEIVLGMASQVAEREDHVIAPDVRGFYWGPLEFARRDWAAITVQRGRDLGLPDYNTARAGYGLEPLASFSDIFNSSFTDDADLLAARSAVLANLSALHGGNLSTLDVFTGGLLETGAGPGPLFRAIIVDQFTRIRTGDRFWYANRDNGLFNDSEIATIEATRFSDIIVRNSDVPRAALQADVFHVLADAPCAQPYQLVANDTSRLAACTRNYGHDYFHDSEWMIPVILFLVGLAQVLLCLAAYLAVRYRQRAQERITDKLRLRADKRQRAAAAEGGGATGGASGLYAAHLLCQGEFASRVTERPVSVKLLDNKLLILSHDGTELFDQLSYRMIESLETCRPGGNKGPLQVLLDCPKRYDVMLVLHDKADEFVHRLSATIQAARGGAVRQYEMASLWPKKTRARREAELKHYFKVLLDYIKTHDPSLLMREDGAAAPPDAGDLAPARSGSLRRRTELTIEDFADAFALDPESELVHRLFELADKDGNGLIGLAEFAEVVELLEGDPLRLQAFLGDDKEHIATLLYQLRDELDVPLNDTQIERMAAKAAKSYNRAAIMMQKRAAAAGAPGDYKVQPGDATTPKGDGAGRSPTLGRSATSGLRRFGTSYGTGLIRHASTGIFLGTGPQIDLTLARAPRTKAPPAKLSMMQRVRSVRLAHLRARCVAWLRTADAYLRDHMRETFILILWVAFTIGIFLERYMVFKNQRELAGLRRISFYGVATTRGAASVQMWAYSALLLPMCRNTITFLRGTAVANIIPFDSAYTFHKIAAVTGLIGSVLHIGGHFCNFYNIVTQPPEDLNCLFRAVFADSYELHDFAWWLFNTLTGLSGFILTVIMMIIFTFAIKPIRRYVFILFWSTHQMYILFYFFMYLHGSYQLVQYPLTFLYNLGPLVLFMMDKLYGARVTSVLVKSLPETETHKGTKLLESGVTRLVFQRPKGFDYKSGQWARVAIAYEGYHSSWWGRLPGLGLFYLRNTSFHPFTLTSAPQEKELSMHIRRVGPWTTKLRGVVEEVELLGRPQPILYVQGPFGESNQDWIRNRVSVLVAGGIGVTPYVSILRDLIFRLKTGSLQEQIEKVYFVWVSQDQKQFEWVNSELRELKMADTTNRLEILTFLTRTVPKFQLRASLLGIFQAVSDGDAHGPIAVGGLRSNTFFGRPDFRKIYAYVEEQHVGLEGLESVGVLTTGPPQLTNDVVEGALNHNADPYTGLRFIAHAENF